MEILASAEIDETWGDSQMGYGPDQGTTYLILKCLACEKRSVISYCWQEGMEHEQIDYEIMFPAEVAYPAGLPGDILQAYIMAEKIKRIDANAYATQMRRLLEKVCLQHNAKPDDSLAKMLKELADKGEIPQKLVKVAEGLKNFGNVGAHAGAGELSKSEIPIVSALATAILEYVYTAPHLAEIAEEKIQQIRSKSK